PLKLIPADAAFYSTMIRTGEQIDIVAKSKAWAKLMAMPGIKQLRQMAETHLKQPDNPQVAAVLQLYRQPENQQLIALLKDMISQEIFCYGGESLNGFLDLVAKLQGGSRLKGVASRLQGGADAANAQIGAVLQTLAENQELLKFPDFVLGFKLSKAEPAEAQLKRLEQFLTKLEQQLPPNLKGRIKRGKEAGGDFLTIKLDGSLVPWQMIP